MSVFRGVNGSGFLDATSSPILCWCPKTDEGPFSGLSAQQTHTLGSRDVRRKLDGYSFRSAILDHRIFLGNADRGGLASWFGIGGFVAGGIAAQFFY